MRKYLQIYKATIIENLHYVTNIIIGFFSFLMMIFVLFNLWEYMYQDNSSYTLQGGLGEPCWEQEPPIVGDSFKYRITLGSDARKMSLWKR